MTAPGAPASLPALLAASAARFPDRRFLHVPGPDGARVPLTFAAFARRVAALATALADLGVAPGDRVGLIANNRPEWLLADLAILSMGAADVPRGSDMTPKDLAGILGHSEAVGCFVEDSKVLERLVAAKGDLPLLRFAVVMHGEAPRDGQLGLPIEELVRRGEELLGRGDQRVEVARARVGAGDLATIIYTSGTSGEPKGVRLRHGNLLHNVHLLPDLLTVTPDDVYLSVLPAWHAFERMVDYVILATGASMAYSSPARQVFLRDLAEIRPTLLAAVPRVWEALVEAATTAAEKRGRFASRVFHLMVGAAVRRVQSRYRLEDRDPVPPPSGARPSRLGAALTAAVTAPLASLAERRVFGQMRERLGGRVRVCISGGGALPAAVDDFFAAAGLPILEGYGLTETSPVLCVRRPARPVPRTVGEPVAGTEIRIAGPDGADLPRGAVGKILARGPQVMEGYHRRKDLTQAVLSADGWFDTGDLGCFTAGGQLRIVGRAKDTIALRSGEKVEPEPIETRLRESPLISHVVVVGQDQHLLGALVVPKVEALAARLGTAGAGAVQLVADPRAVSLVEQEITRLLTAEAGFKRHERVGKVRLLPEDFQVGRELTPTLKVRRLVVAEQYKATIAEMFA